MFTEDELIEIRSIIEEVSRKFGDGAVSMGEIRPTNTAPVLVMNENQIEPKLSPKEPKIKLLFRRPGEPMLYMAGMINTFMDKNGKEKDSFVILTTAANASFNPFHDRMPVIISPGERDDWISSESFMREVLTREVSELEWEIAG